MTTDLSKNLQALEDNGYPGRGIIIGLNDDGNRLIQVYWIMGRSDNSRNRVFERDTAAGRVWTSPADATKVKDPSLIIYNAMIESKGHYVVSNGAQTDTVADMMAAGGGLTLGLSRWKYEPDEPNFTPRITGVCSLNGPSLFEMSLLRRTQNGETARHFYLFDGVSLGAGYCLTTYSGDGNPLPSFTGDPYLLPLKGSMYDISRLYWNTLNKENLVSLVVKSISIKNGVSVMAIQNRYQKV